MVPSSHRRFVCYSLDLPSPYTFLAAGACLEASCLLKAALALLVAWLLGVVSVYDSGSFVHVLLLVALMLLLLGVLKGRDAAAAGRSDSH